MVADYCVLINPKTQDTLYYLFLGSHAGEAGSCTAAAFLHEFVSCKHWAHLDIAGVMENTDHVLYLGKGMSGRPTRTLIKYLSSIRFSDYAAA